MQNEQIDCDETIGRGIFSERVAEKLRNGLAIDWRKVRSLLTPGKGKDCVSADRLDKADCFVLTKFHDSKAPQRAQPSKFYGWFQCKARIFKACGGTVRASGTTENPSHCDVSVELQGRMQVLDFLSSIPIEHRWKKRCD